MMFLEDSGGCLFKSIGSRNGDRTRIKTCESPESVLPCCSFPLSIEVNCNVAMHNCQVIKFILAYFFYFSLLKTPRKTWCYKFMSENDRVASKWCNAAICRGGLRRKIAPFWRRRLPVHAVGDVFP
jgi:hypothetical protein